MSITTFEADKAQLVEQLAIVLGALNDDPNNADLIALKEELDSGIAMCDETIAELRSTTTATKTATTTTNPQTSQQAAEAHSPASPPPPPSAANPEKRSRDGHPGAFKKAVTAAPQAEDKEAEVAYQVNDSVMAKWVSGDKAFYPARITSITGSSTDPIYTVRFKSYDTVETLRSRDIRPVATASSSAQKRKADGTLTSASAAPDQTAPPIAHNAGAAPAEAAALPSYSKPATGSERRSNGVVLSASATRYTQPQEGGGIGSETAAGIGEKPAKKSKIRGKELEANKKSWHAFNSKSKAGKAQKKDSMFRTPEGINGRVGFTGSGQAMRKDPTRSRHVYQPNEDLD